MALITKVLTNLEGTYARIEFDSDFEEFTVKFYQRGLILRNAHYYTSDESDAKATAQAELSRMAGVTVVHPLD